MNSISELNQSLCSDNQLQIVTLEEFKRLHKGNRNSTKFERFVASIKKVEDVGDGYRFTIDNGNGTIKTLSALTNGLVTFNDGTFRYNLDTNKGHYRVNCNNNTILVEKLIGLGKLIIDDELPNSFRGLCVNVLDASGNPFTAQKLGIKVDLSLRNIEWTLNDWNFKHGRRVVKFFKETGHVYRISANDKEFAEAYQLKTNEEILEYVSTHCEQVK